METKTSKAIALFNGGQIKESLRIFKTFKMGISKDQKRTLEIAYESLTGKASFYQGLGIDTLDQIEKAKALISDKFLN